MAQNCLSIAAMINPRHNNPLQWFRTNPLTLALLLTITGTIFYFYCALPLFGNFREQSVTHWIWAICGKPEYDYGHGRFVPLAMVFLVFRSWKKIAAAPRSSEWWGLALLILGILFYIVSVRTIQARMAAGSIPFIIYGLIAFLWGRHAAKHFIFPLALIYFAIPLPGLTQATNGLQIIATQIAYHISSLCGADVTAAGTNIQSATGQWDALKIAEGCSGVRSLIALTFIAAVYGYLTQDKLWKQGILILVSIPMAILANSIRVTTIVLIAEYWNADFAAKTYHNFSGFIFFPLGLAGLLLVSFLINGGWKRERQTTTRRIIKSANTGSADTE
ncbi:MAG: exosortase/archaeosortase family protein [Verrucomicrobiales bacterium]